MPETLNANSQVETEITDDLILRGEEQHRQGCKLYEQDRYPEALTFLNDALLQGESAERWNDWATVQLASSDYELAEQGYRRALQLNPRDPQAALNLAVLLTMREQQTEALPLLDLCIEYADEPQRSAALRLREECAKSVPAAPPTPAEPQEIEPPAHLGGHCNVSHTDEGVLDYLIEKFHIRSMLDIGCGLGGMVHLAKQKGLRAVGVDGDPKVRQLSGLEPSELIIHDFTQGPLELDEQFDLIWSVEFLEHVEEQFQDNYMALFRQGKFVFCTAASPGKPGIHHVNCREMEYWREVFRRHCLHYDHGTSENLRSVSTMPREFVRETGMFFLLDAEGSRERFTPQMQTQIAQTTPFDFIDKEHFASTPDREAAKALFQRSVSMVAIEVFSYCNRLCWFCPNATIDRRSTNNYMPVSLYNSILNELAEIDYAGLITYSLYNEPLADKVILERLCQARATLPNATLHTNTNGDYLTPDYLDQLYASGLRSLNIQAYLGNKDPYDHERIRAKIDKLTAKLGLSSTMVRDEPGTWLEVRLEYKNMAIRLYGRNFAVNGCNRGEEVPIAFHQPRTSPCLSPFYHFLIDYNGSVMPCCNLRSDSPLHKECVITNLNDQPGIFLAYASETASQWRRSLIGYGEKEGVCKTCRFVEFDPTPANQQKNAELARAVSSQAVLRRLSGPSAKAKPLIAG